jgi:ABC-2 type transport system ATP-binding protein
MESVEELCDSIALINLSHKILDGKVKAIRNSYRNNTYFVEYTGDKLNFNGAAPFEILSDASDEERHTIKISLKAGSSANEVLQYLIPKVSISMLQEVIPSMHEIFIEKVNQKSA